MQDRDSLVVVALCLFGPWALLVLALCLLAPWAAGAASLEFGFTGTVTQAQFDPDDPFAGGIAFGTTFSGTYTFDSGAADGAADPQTGSYPSAGPPYGISVDFGGGHVFALGDALSIGVGNDYAGPVDHYTVLGTSAAGDQLIELFLTDDAAAVFATDALPAALCLADFSWAEFTLRWDDFEGNQVEIQGTIDSLTAPVPEPGSLLLVGAGLAALRARRRRASER